MEACLGGIQLKWCLIYLNDMILFFENTKELSSLVERSLSETWRSGTQIEAQ